MRNDWSWWLSAKSGGKVESTLLGVSELFIGSPQDCGFSTCLASVALTGIPASPDVSRSGHHVDTGITHRRIF